MQTVLIANRGEIARRVIRACRETGRRSVAIYTDLDRDALHIDEADVAVRVESYLDPAAVIAAAKEAAATAIHPGYGFLSENADFARAVADAGLTFIGPSADVIDSMGAKDKARDIAVAAGVPVVPSYVVDQVEEMAFPVLVKATAGGGGKGMRIVRSAEGFAEGLGAAQREAKKAFGNDTVLVEKYVERGRHIEVQVMGDSHGNVVHLFERDCSTQRRHQKVLEEAPAPTLSDEARQRVLDAAVALARHVDYVNAGTVEFLLDVDTDEVYFLEMNTRLQVEHPVTELVTGVDLVQWQLDIAEGQAIPLAQADITCTGHAIEARVYAEDPWQSFLPQAGRASIVQWPSAPRVDAALESGSVVSTAYDPMLGKIITCGEDREVARWRLVQALDDLTIQGLTTNAGFLRVLADSDEFRDASIDTAWLDRHEVTQPGPEIAAALASWVAADKITGSGPWQPDGWRGFDEYAPITLRWDRNREVVRIDADQGRVGDVELDEVWIEEYPHLIGVTAEIAGEPHSATLTLTREGAEINHHGQRWVLKRPDPFSGHDLDAGDGSLTAPMPGTVLEVRVHEGDAVEAGQVLATMEAMKMELSLEAPFAGTVSTVAAATGDLVQLGAVLVKVEQ